ncbi:unnamed protein product [Acanthoscelides obtectus]|uniref:Uncharacterized protein n=1 Tax=Acanthoscelides obtectus TaxID=200917 RepID=A0A9P0PYN9_ACAOB|nr:unnamed protein product [Acanthoscelides obtectus]CAK1671393.1 hypothetical protein AOBTE_LOCUS28247 [Acanthoscelides obtectus]
MKDGPLALQKINEEGELCACLLPFSIKHEKMLTKKQIHLSIEDHFASSEQRWSNRGIWRGKDRITRGARNAMSLGDSEKEPFSVSKSGYETENLSCSDCHHQVWK